MKNHEPGLRVVDLYCGAGGFSEGFRQAGFDIVAGIDNWAPALESHGINGFGEPVDFDMLKLVDDGGYALAKEMADKLQQKHGRIDVLIGSPPCTEFSYAKKGGKGDVERGMLLVRAYLVFVAALKPTYWLLENVPRLEQAIESESTKKNATGWTIPLERLGVDGNLSGLPWVSGRNLHVLYGRVHVASQFGAPQRRRRFIAGNLDPALMDSKRVDHERTMRECMETLWRNSNNGIVTDPNYRHHKVKRASLRDYFYDTRVHPMYWEEMRHLKRRHIQYGRISYPDDMDRPARTIMATLGPSSREAIALDTGEVTSYQGKQRPVFRQPTVREVACIQGFPIDFQFWGPNLETRYKQVGNAVPCQLSYALALSVLDSLGRSGFENGEQEQRYRATVEKREANQNRPIVVGPRELVDEADDFGQSKYLTFRARENKHIRRKLLSAKPFSSSAVVIFENTEWKDDHKVYGGFWKSCLQSGVGKHFSQVYLDEKSVGTITQTIDDYFDDARTAEAQTTLSAYVAQNQEPGNNHENAQQNRLAELQGLVAHLYAMVDDGVPVVPKEWDEFPGYDSQKAQEYLGMHYEQRLPLPSASELQRMFTTHCPDTKGYIGPIDFFDGIDYLMLGMLGPPDKRWVHQVSIPFKQLCDKGSSLHRHRISSDATDIITGSLPLVALIGSLLSVHILERMHALDETSDNPNYQSLSKASAKIRDWSGFEGRQKKV